MTLLPQEFVFYSLLVKKNGLCELNIISFFSDLNIFFLKVVAVCTIELLGIELLHHFGIFQKIFFTIVFQNCNVCNNIALIFFSTQDVYSYTIWKCGNELLSPSSICSGFGAVDWRGWAVWLEKRKEEVEVEVVGEGEVSQKDKL